MSKSSQRVICILSLSLIPLLNGCQDTSPYTRTKPKMSDIVGTWVNVPVTDEDSDPVQDSKKAGSKKIANSQIVLRSDGTFSIQNMPSFLFGDRGRGERLVSDSGTWDLNKDACDGDDCWWGVALWPNKITSIQANAFGSQAPYFLEIEWTENEYYMLQKKQPSK